MHFKNILSLIFFIFCVQITIAQNKKLGINTATPTEMLDIQETMRVRVLPNNGTSYVNGQGSSVVFNPVNPVVNSSDGYNIVGKNSKAELVPNNLNSSFNTTNNSSAMFVIKRIFVDDWPSDNGNVGISTSMFADKWEAVMSNVGFNITVVDALSNVFNQRHLQSYTVFVNNLGEWRIIGDINGVQEQSFVDILFIKKGVVAAETRTGKYDY